MKSNVDIGYKGKPDCLKKKNLSNREDNPKYRNGIRRIRKNIQYSGIVRFRSLLTIKEKSFHVVSP